MDFEEYKKLAVRTCSPPEQAIQRLTYRQIDSLLGITEEIEDASRRMDAFKRVVFYGKEPATKDNTALPDPEERVTPQTMNAIHASVGLLTEASELSEAIIYKSMDGDPIDEANVFEELGDIMWYIALLCETLGIDMKKVWKANIDKLAARYGDKFDDYKAINRDLQAESKALEEHQ